MKHRAILLPVFSILIAATSGCFDDPTCPYGQVLVHDGSYRGNGVCMRLANGAGGSGSAPAKEASPSASGGAAPAPSTPAAEPATGDDPSGTTTPPAAAGGVCGGLDANSDSVRVVDKSDAPPALNDVPPNLADGSYALVQATSFSTGQAASPVRSLRAGIEVRGSVLTVNAQDTSVAGLPKESLTFLLASSGVTKTCDSAHGAVSAWFFPVAVGGTTQAHLQLDGPSGFLRLVVNRAGGSGSTELVFAR